MNYSEIKIEKGFDPPKQKGRPVVKRKCFERDKRTDIYKFLCQLEIGDSFLVPNYIDKERLTACGRKWKGLILSEDFKLASRYLFSEFRIWRIS